jgi:hypothetical protein
MSTGAILDPEGAKLGKAVEDGLSPIAMETAEAIDYVSPFQLLHRD